MKSSQFWYFFNFAIKTILFRKKDPILGTIILTDKCNLKCKHCAVNNITGIIHPYEKIKNEMKMLYEKGVRILFFCGGETFLWEDKGKRVRDLVIEAKEMGFMLVNVVTNGTFKIDLPEASLILLSLDGSKEKHNNIRGDTFDTIINNIRNATSDNICLYMAVNQINKKDVRAVADIAKNEKNIKAISFNFHTPYKGTEALSLSIEDKKNICSTLRQLIKEGYPIFNLKSAFNAIVYNKFKTPCHQCLVLENGKISVCGRCIDEEGLCDSCGYFFAAEYSLVFHGNIIVCFDMLKTYLRYI